MVSLAQVQSPGCSGNTSNVRIHPTASLRNQTSVALAQFRPEKDHAKQLRAFAMARQKAASAAWTGSLEAVLVARLKLIGSCRDADDEQRVERLVRFFKDWMISATGRHLYPRADKLAGGSGGGPGHCAVCGLLHQCTLCRSAAATGRRGGWPAHHAGRALRHLGGGVHGSRWGRHAWFDTASSVVRSRGHDMDVMPVQVLCPLHMTQAALAWTLWATTIQIHTVPALGAGLGTCAAPWRTMHRLSMRFSPWTRWIGCTLQRLRAGGILFIFCNSVPHASDQFGRAINPNCVAHTCAGKPWTTQILASRRTSCVRSSFTLC